MDSEDDTTSLGPDRDGEASPRDRALEAVRDDMDRLMTAAAEAGPPFVAVLSQLQGFVQNLGQEQASRPVTVDDKAALAALKTMVTTMCSEAGKVMQPGLWSEAGNFLQPGAWSFDVNARGLYAYRIRSLNVKAIFIDDKGNERVGTETWCVLKVGMAAKRSLTVRVAEEVDEIRFKWRGRSKKTAPRADLTKQPGPKHALSRDVVFTLQGERFTGLEQICRDAVGFQIGEAKLDLKNKSCRATVNKLGAESYTKRGKLESADGWAKWFMKGGGPSKIGPSELIVMPTRAVVALQAKYATGNVHGLKSLGSAGPLPDRFELDFVETAQSLGPLRVWNKSGLASSTLAKRKGKKG